MANQDVIVGALIEENRIISSERLGKVKQSNIKYSTTWLNSILFHIKGWLHFETWKSQFKIKILSFFNL